MGVIQQQRWSDLSATAGLGRVKPGVMDGAVVAEGRVSFFYIMHESSRFLLRNLLNANLGMKIFLSKSATRWHFY